MTMLEKLAAKRGITLDPVLLVKYPIGTWFYGIHHNIIAEQLTEPLELRLECVLKTKPKEEWGIRLAAIRPVKHPDRLPAQYVKDDSVRAKSHFENLGDLMAQWSEEYPHHPEWRPAGLVFPESES